MVVLGAWDRLATAGPPYSPGSPACLTVGLGLLLFPPAARPGAFDSWKRVAPGQGDLLPGGRPVHPSASPVSVPRCAALGMGFLALLPRLETHARFAFRHNPCPHDRDAAVAEALALGWAWDRRLAK